EINYLVFALGVVAILLLVLGERIFPARPVGLAVVALSIVVASAFALPDRGVPATGEVTAGLPSLPLPRPRLRDGEGGRAPAARGGDRSAGGGMSAARLHRRRVRGTHVRGEAWL